MKIGIIGLSKSGKSTIFNSLTGQSVDTNSFTGSSDVNQGVVEVFDEKIREFSEEYKPKKTIYATIEFADYPGMEQGNDVSDWIKGTTGSLIKSSDAFAVVLRNFDDDIVNSMLGEVNPIRDLYSIDSELVLNDLIIIEKRLEKILLGYKRGIKDNTILLEEKILNMLLNKLNEEIPLRDVRLSEEEKKIIRGFQFLSLKPLMIVINSDERSFGHNDTLIEKLSVKYQTIEFAGKFESELNGLDDEDKLVFMEDMGIESSAKDTLTKLSYELLGYISFFTVGSDEVRAWTIENGTIAVDAAGKIHSDLARGFIRAECFNYKDWKELGSEKAIKEKGLFRLEGKNYIVKDGDVLNIRFNV